MTILNILNIILSQFNLEWNNSKGLLYKYSGTIHIQINTGIIKVFEFIGIHEDITSEIPDDKLVELFAKSNKIDTGALSLSIEMFDGNSLEHKILKDLVENHKGISCIPFNDYIEEIEKYFEIDLKGQIQKAEEQESKNKFNGNLVMYWMPEVKKGPVVKDTMKDFIEHIEISKNIPFKSYVKLTKHKDIKEDFLSYMNINLN